VRASSKGDGDAQKKRKKLVRRKSDDDDDDDDDEEFKASAVDEDDEDDELADDAVASDDSGAAAANVRVVKRKATSDVAMTDNDAGADDALARLQKQFRDEVASLDLDVAAAATTERDMQRFDEQFAALQSRRRARNAALADAADGADGEDEANNDEDDDEPTAAASSSKGKRGAAASSSAKTKYTPLENQYLELRAANPGVLLAIECGYKFEFFGEDAEIAHRLLRVAIFTQRTAHFPKCCVPTNRIFYHIRRLVIAGYKVGIVRQTETAALKKVSSSKSKTFDRQVDKLFTRATFVGSDDIDPLSAREDDESGGYLMLLREEAIDKDGGARFAFVALHTATGEVVYDRFNDVFLRTELDTRLELLEPKELLIQRGSLSAQTQALISHRSGFQFADGEASTSAVPSAKREQRGRMRVEELEPAWFDVAAAGTVIKDFCLQSDQGAQQNSDDGDEDGTEEVPALQVASPVAAAAADVAALAALPDLALVCVSALVTYTAQLRHLGPLLRCHENYRRFSAAGGASVCNVPGAAARNLDLFESSVAGFGTRGTLFAHLDRSRSALGSRELRRWLMAPLADAARIRERQCAVALLRTGTDRVFCLAPLEKVLRGAPDIERGLARVYNRSCAPAAFVKLLDSFVEVLNALPSAEEAQRQFAASPYLVRLLDGGGHARAVRQCVADALAALSREGAAANDMQRVFASSCTLFPDVTSLTQAIARKTSELETTHLNEARRVVQVPTLVYKTVSGAEYLVEVTTAQKARVPADWSLISSTQKAARYRSPAISAALQELQQSRDRLSLAANAAWQRFQARFAAGFGALRAVVNAVATLDALLALADVAVLPGYVQPTIEDAGAEPLFDARDSRHPVLEALDLATTASGSAAYVPNDIAIGAASAAAPHARRCMVVTGPNMGGKSSCVRQVATLALMAQVGSFVPATSLRMRPFDGVYVRMGASDNLAAGHSTFFVELHETSGMLQRATARSLLVLDELGRGTSTADGTAIAHATLEHIARNVGAACLFVTHYPSIGVELERALPQTVGNFHMGYVAHEADGDGVPSVSFLYKLRPGGAAASYGLNVARMAGINAGVLRVAATQSEMLQRSELVTQFMTVAGQAMATD
jgi:DNA mismatch repair protein MSH3